MSGSRLGNPKEWVLNFERKLVGTIYENDDGIGHISIGGMQYVVVVGRRQVYRYYRL
jgi:hypothetical protein